MIPRCYFVFQCMMLKKKHFLHIFEVHFFCSLVFRRAQEKANYKCQLAFSIGEEMDEEASKFKHRISICLGQ